MWILAPLNTHHRVWVLFIVEDPTMTKMQNINKSAVPLLEFVSSYDIRLSVMFIYSHILSYLLEYHRLIMKYAYNNYI